jgi:hypothetical protein
VASDLFASRDQKFGRLLPWHSVLSGPGDLLARDQYRPEALVQLALLVTVVVATGVAMKRGRTATIPILAIPVWGTFAVLSVLRFGVADRFVSFLLVPLSLLGAIALSAAFAVRGALLRALLVAVIMVAFVISARDFWHIARPIDDVPFENFLDSAEFVNGTHIDTVVSNSTHHEGLDYYLRPDLGIIRRTDRLERFLCRAEPPFVYIDHPFVSDEPSVACLERRGVPRHVFRQRGRGRRIVVYVVRDRPSG